MIARIVDVLKVLGVWVLILISVFALIEGCFRIFRNDAPNPLADVAQKRSGALFSPNARIHSRSSIPGEFEYDAQINRYGYRGRDFVMPKPAGIKRIFAVGDSFTFGVGAPDHETIPFLLEKGLLTAGYPIEVVNAGIGGSSPVSQYLNIRDIDLKYQPDAVVFFLISPTCGTTGTASGARSCVRTGISTILIRFILMVIWTGGRPPRITARPAGISTTKSCVLFKRCRYWGWLSMPARSGRASGPRP